MIGCRLKAGDLRGFDLQTETERGILAIFVRREEDFRGFELQTEESLKGFELHSG